jgi:hypothetical protein
MKRSRVAGRFVGQDLDGESVAGQKQEESKGLGGAPKPRHCRTYTRARIAEALPEIVERFVEEAKKGSIAHAKMLASLGGLDRHEVLVEKKRRGKSAVGKLIEKMMKDPRQ